jgi:hypothetical protein
MIKSWRLNEMGKTYRRHRRNKSAYQILIGKPGGKRSLGKPRHSSEDNIKMEVFQNVD